MTSPVTSTQFRFGDFLLEPSERRLLAHGRLVRVGPRAFDLLTALVEHPGQLLTKDQLLAYVWPDRVIEDANLHVQISALRRVLGQGTIATIAGHGYRLVIAVERINASASSTSTAPTHNLPRALTRFIGREEELALLEQSLSEARLLTLTGIGGAGKTRLAISLSERVAHSFRDGVRFVDLAPIGEPALVVHTAASAFGIREAPHTTVEETLVAHLAGRSALIVLDNCEHLATACAAVAKRLLAASPDVKLLMTSREPLRIRGERVVAVRPLALPPADATHAPRELEQFDAIRLFVDRANDAVPQFVLTANNASAVAEICRRLDGIPLALELAAARVKTLSVNAILAKLDDRFRLLTSASDGQSRHQTLLAAIKWSYDHLGVDEQRCLLRLSIFPDSFSLDAAAAVTAMAKDEIDMLDLIDRLVDASLLVALHDPLRPTRYSLLETVREFATRRLRDAGEYDAARECHLLHFVALAKQAQPRLFKNDAKEWTERIDVEMPNLLAAHAWCDQAEDGAKRGLELAFNLRTYFLSRGLFALGQKIYDDALNRPGAEQPTLERARTLFALAQHNYVRGRQQDLIGPTEEALSIARSLGDDELTIRCLDKMGAWHSAMGHFTRALECTQDQLDAAQRTGESRLVVNALMSRGNVLRANDDHVAAAAAFDSALHSCDDDLLNRHTCLLNVARVAIARNMLGRATSALHEADALLDQMGSPYSSVMVIEVVARLAAARGDHRQAARLQGFIDAAVARMGSVPGARDDRALTGLLEKPREILGAEEYAAAYDAGRGLSLDEALAEARRSLLSDAGS